MKRLRKLSVVILLPVFFAFMAVAQEKPLAFQEFEVGVVEHLGEYIPEGIMLIDVGDSLVSLKSLIDKPTILNFVYFRCPGVCTPLMNGLAEAAGKVDMIAGKDYQIITISFDPTETQEVAQKKRNNYLQMIGKDIDPLGWRFYVADSLNVMKATEATGFRFKKQANDFIHSATLIFISPEGKITRYLNGTYFLPFDFKMAIIEAGKGKVGPTINKFMQYCFSYDSEGQRYVVNITKIAGTMILFLGLLIFIFLLIKGRSKKAKTTNE
jgi:protein SCO1